MEIDLVTQRFKAHILLEASWVDHDMKDIDLQAHPWEKSDDTIALQRAGVLRLKERDETFFAPRLSFRNLVETTDEDMWYTIYGQDAQGNKLPSPIISLRWELTAVFQDVFILHSFPLDAQELTFELLTGNETVQLVRNQNGLYRSTCNTDTFPLGSEYVLSKRVRFTEDQTKASASMQGNTYSLLLMDIHVERQVSYWILNVVMPMAMITGATFMSYFVPPADFADRCSITLTMMLAQVAYKYLVGEKLPNLGYATLIDMYVLLCFIIAFVIGVLQCPVAIGLYTEPTTEVSVTEGGETRTVQVPILGVALIVGWAGLHALLFCVAVPLRRFLRQRREPFWRQGRYRENAVYIGPAVVDETTDIGKVETEVRELVSKLEMNQQLKRVLVWSPSAIVESMRNSGCELPQNVNTGFVVGVMQSSDDMEELVDKWKSGGQAPHPWWAKRPIKIEPLDSGWAPLTISRTYSRGKAVNDIAAAGDQRNNKVAPDR